MQTKELMTLQDFLAQYSISRTTAYREMLIGRLHFTKVGRRSYITYEDAQAWLRKLKKTRGVIDILAVQGDRT